MSKDLIFQKRDKLVYSPESKEKTQMEIENNIKATPEMSQSQSNLQDLIEKTELQIYKFDKVLNHTISDEKIYQDLFEKVTLTALNKKKNLVFFNIGKSHTIFNFNSDDNLFNSQEPLSNAGILPILIKKALESQREIPATPSKLFDNEITFNSISISSFLCSNNKFYNLFTADGKPLSNIKEVSKVHIEKMTSLKPLLMNLKAYILNKKLPIEFICHKIKFHDPKLKRKGQKSSITLFDFPYPFDKTAEKSEKENSKNENTAEHFVQPIKTLYSLLSNEKNSSVTTSSFS